MTDGAVDIHRFPASAADEVMVVVAGARLVAGGRSGRLDAAYQTLFRKDREGVINGLTRNRADSISHVNRDGVRRAVRPAGHSPQHRNALSRHGQAVFAEKIGGICHWIGIRLFLDFVKNWIQYGRILILGSEVGMACNTKKYRDSPARIAAIKGLRQDHAG